MFGLALNTMASLFLCILIGFIGAKKKVISLASIDELNKFLLNICFPFMMVSIFNIELTADFMDNGLQVFGYGLLYQLILMIIGFGVIRLLDFGLENKKILLFSFIFVNGGFIGIPLISSVLGAEGLLYASIINIPFNITCFSLGVYFLDKSEDVKVDLKALLLSPVMIGVWVGLFLLLSQLVVPYTFEVDGVTVRLPSAMTKTINMVGGITSPLAMIVVGASLEQTNIGKVLKDVRLHIFSLLKLIVAPLIASLVLSPIISDPLILTVVVIFSGLPTATVAAVLAERYGHDYIFASEIIFITTLYSLITIPTLFLILT